MLLIKDRVYCPSASVPSIWDAGMELYLKRMINTPIQNHLVHAILNQIEIERGGLAINRSAVKSCVEVLLALHDEKDGGSISVYKRDIEHAVLEKSRLFYEEEGERLLQACDAPEYLRRVCAPDSGYHYEYSNYITF